MFNIEINDNFNFLSKDQIELINKVANHIFELEKLEGDLFFEINIIDNKKIKIINNKYRNKNNETDVITFSFWDSITSIKSPLVGEIFLSKDKVISQSIKYEHSLERELFFLIVHGILHLLGYDHQNVKDEKIMFDKQKKILNFFKINK